MPAEAEGGHGVWCAAWLRIGEGYLGGVQHALNNRVAALSALSQVLRSGVGGGLEEVLAEEVDRLQAMVGHLSLLRQSRHDAPEPLELAPALRAAAELLPQHSEVGDVACRVEGEEGVLPLVAPPALLTRLLLTLLAATALAAPATGATAIRARVGGDESWVTLWIEPDGEGVAEALGEAAEPVVREAELAWALEALGGAWVEGAAAGGFALRLPTLLEVRRRERAGS